MQASGGLAGLPTPDHEYAQGGIVAFQDRGYVSPELTLPPGTEYDPGESGVYANEREVSSGDPREADKELARSTLKAYVEHEPEAMSRADVAKERQDYYDFLKANAGPDIYAPQQEKLTAREAARAGDRRSGEGLALLHAAGAILKGNTLARGASEAFPAYANQMAEVKRADMAEQDVVAP
jgi:hypothetical protein